MPTGYSPKRTHSTFNCMKLSSNCLKNNEQLLRHMHSQHLRPLMKKKKNHPHLTKMLQQLQKQENDVEIWHKVHQKGSSSGSKRTAHRLLVKDKSHFSRLRQAWMEDSEMRNKYQL